jgi:hypothetical protein
MTEEKEYRDWQKERRNLVTGFKENSYRTDSLLSTEQLKHERRIQKIMQSYGNR